MLKFTNQCLILALSTLFLTTGCTGFSSLSRSTIGSLRSILTANGQVSGIPAFDASRAFWKQGVPVSLDSAAGCNAIASVQIPDQPNLFLGRSSVGSACPNLAFTMFLGQMDWNTKQVKMIKTILDVPSTFNNGTMTINTAYDPTIEIINGEYWVAFECGVNEIQGTVGSCVAPFSVDGGIDKSRLSLVIKGQSVNAANDYYPSGSVPKIVQYNGHDYLYWSMMRVPKSGTGYGDVRTRGVEIAIGSDGKMHAVGMTSPLAADSPRSVEVASLGSDSYTNTINDLSEVFVLNGTLFAFGQLGGTNGAGCINPLAASQGCYRTYLVKVSDPLGANAFGTGSRVPEWMLPSDVGQYPRLVRDPNGQVGVMGSFLSARFGNPNTNPRSAGDSDFYIFPLPTSGTFFGGGDVINDFAQPVVNETYQAFFGRNADVGAVQNWAAYAYSGPYQIDYLNAFFNSAEYQAKLGSSNSDFISVLYSSLLGRAVDSGALAGWTSNLDQGILTRHGVFTQIIYSAEFRALHPSLAPDIGAPDAAAAPSPVLSPAPLSPSSVTIATAGNANISVAIASLTNLNANCTIDTLASVSCKSAANQICLSQGYANGYGPTEAGNGSAVIACVNGSTTVGASFAQMLSVRGDCTADNVSKGACMSAANALCASNGFGSGFGPVDIGGNQMNVVCLASNNLVASSFTQLAQIQPACSASDPASLACHSAVNRACQARGYTSGFGPVDYVGDSANFECF